MAVTMSSFLSFSSSFISFSYLALPSLRVRYVNIYFFVSINTVFTCSFTIKQKTNSI